MTLHIFNAKTNDWTKRTSPPKQPGHYCAAMSIQNHKFVILGGTSNPQAVQLFDFVPKQWPTLPDMPTGGQGLAAAVVDDDLIIVVGGTNNCDEMYSMTTNTWTKFPSICPQIIDSVRLQQLEEECTCSVTRGTRVERFMMWNPRNGVHCLPC